MWPSTRNRLAVTPVRGASPDVQDHPVRPVQDRHRPGARHARRRVAPWRSPILGRSSAGHPRNLDSGRAYRGVNTFLLAFAAHARGYESSYWATFNQARARGGMVRKGEKASMVVFWKTYDTTDRKSGEPVRVPVLRYYNVFNLAQIDGLAAPDAVPFTPVAFDPIAACEGVVTGYAGRPTVVHGGSLAFYRPADDSVQMPDPGRFETAEQFYSTLFTSTPIMPHRGLCRVVGCGR